MGVATLRFFDQSGRGLAHVVDDLIRRRPRTMHDQPLNAEIGKALHGIEVELAARRDADLERSQCSRANVLLRRLPQTVDTLGRLFEIERKTVPAVTVLDRAPERRLGTAADDD